MVLRAAALTCQLSRMTESSRPMVTRFCEILIKQNPTTPFQDLLQIARVFCLLKFRGRAKLRQFDQKQKFRIAAEALMEEGLKKGSDEPAPEPLPSRGLPSARRSRSLLRALGTPAVPEEDAKEEDAQEGAGEGGVRRPMKLDPDEERAWSSAPYRVPSVFRSTSAKRKMRAGSAHLPDQFGVSVAEVFKTDVSIPRSRSQRSLEEVAQGKVNPRCSKAQAKKKTIRLRAMAAKRRKILAARVKGPGGLRSTLADLEGIGFPAQKKSKKKRLMGRARKD